ncbi:MAG: hypothetical protein ACKVXR_01165 [Planctomycetota bacterium]
MKKTKSGASHHAVAYVVSPVIALLVTAALLDPFGISSAAPSRLSAMSSNPMDEDGDGLLFKHERILETLPSAADSDLDGFGDAEELARKTSPVNALVHPQGNAIGLGITARGDRDGLHALVAVYVPDSNYRGLDVNIGRLVGIRPRFLRQSYLNAHTQIEFVAGSVAGSTVALLDVRFPRSWVDATGHLTLFATVSLEGTGRNEAAASMDLFNVGGVIVLAMPDPSYVPPQGSADSPQGPTTLFKPLTLSNGEPPSGWTLGEVCSQTSQTVMVAGATVVHEISSAECEGGWEGACPPDCSSSVGSTYVTLDPVILVGG